MATNKGFRVFYTKDFTEVSNYNKVEDKFVFLIYNIAFIGKPANSPYNVFK